MSEQLENAHKLEYAGAMSSGGYVVRCSCGRSWERSRLVDGAIALERHERRSSVLYDARKANRARLEREVAQ